MDGDIDVYKHFAWLKRVSDWLLYLGLLKMRARETLGECGGWGEYLSGKALSWPSSP